MVLDVVDAAAERATVELAQAGTHVADAAVVLKPRPDRLKAGTMPEREERLVEQVGLGVA